MLDKPARYPGPSDQAKKDLPVKMFAWHSLPADERTLLKSYGRPLVERCDNFGEAMLAELLFNLAPSWPGCRKRARSGGGKWPRRWKRCTGRTHPRRKKMEYTPETEVFDAELSLEIDRATVAIEEAQERGDKFRELLAREWLRKLLAELP